MIRLVFVWVLVALFPQLLQAQPQEIFFSHLTVRDGLSQTGLSYMLQDRQGYMWFGSQDGLNRYDGYKFTVFRNKESDTTSLSNNYITGLDEDKAGNLWVATDYGLNRYNPRTETFTRFVPDSRKSNPAFQSRISMILIDSRQNLWVANRNTGLSRLNLAHARNQQPATARFEHFSVNTNCGLTDSAIVEVFEDRERTLWVITKSKGIFKFDASARKFIAIGGPAEVFESNFFYANFFEDKQSKVLWLGTKKGLYSFNRKTNAFTRHLPQVNDVVFDIEQDKDGTLWFVTQQEILYAWNPRRNLLRKYAHDATNPGSLAKGYLLSLYFDRAGSLWTGVFPFGLCRFDPAVQQFNEYRCPNWESFSSNRQALSGVVEDEKGNLWISYAYQLKLVHLNRQTCQVTEYNVPLPKTDQEMQRGINAIFQDSRKQLWLATIRHGVYKFDPASGSFTSLEPELSKQGIINSISGNQFSEDADGRIWYASTNGGIISWDADGNNARQYLKSASENSLSTNNTLGVFADAGNRVWVGTWGGGLNLINSATGKVTRFSQDAGQPGSFPASAVFAFAFDKQNNFYIATSSGLARTTRDLKTIHWYNETEGLNNLLVRGLCLDNEQNVWLNTGGGISKLDTKNGQVKNLDLNQGRSISASGMGPAVLSRSGELLFCHDQGLVGFKPDQIRSNYYVPPVVLTGIQVLNKPVEINKAEEGEEPLLTQAAGFARHLELDYWQDVITFEFAALNFSQPGENQYAYKLEGFDKDWVHSGHKRFATYTNLDPGTYTFYVKGSNNDGVWNGRAQTIQLTILPPPWKTWWAFLLYGLAISGAVYAVLRYWNARQRLKHKLELKNLEASKLQELDQMKTRFFTNISHEFRTPLTLILGPLESWLAEPGEKPERVNQLRMMRRNARRLLQLINQLMDISKLEAGKLKLKAAEQDLAQFAKGIVYSFSSLAESRGIQLQYHEPAKPLPVYFDQDKLEKIITNLLANAFKFTSEGGAVSVTVKVTPANTAEITVADSGIGIPADRLDKIFNRFFQVDGSHTREQEGTGIGLALTRELVQLHHGQVSVQSELGNGTTFTVSLPLGAAHLSAAEISASPVILDDQIEITPIEMLSDLPATLAVPEEDQENSPLLLIAEDNADVRTYIRDSFKDEFRVLEAVNGEEALALAIEHVPDLVITDLMMPKMDGVELCRRLKLDERTSHIPVVLLTAKATVESRIEGLETGADDYLTKPFQPQELRIRARNLIQVRQRLRERFAQAGPVTVKLEPGEIAVTSADEKFLQRAMAIVEKYMADENFDVEQFGEEMALSRVQLYRKLKALTGQTVSEFIRGLRIKRAAQLLEQGAGTVAEVAYMVGFQNMSYFSKCFKEVHGVSPSEFSNRKAALSPLEE